jgi:hypothetical protein
MKILTQSLVLFITALCMLACGLNKEQTKAAEAALTELKKLDAATEIGINKLEYSKMLINAQAAVKDASSILPDGELKNEINGAMQGYLDAKTVWFIMGEDDFFFACMQQPDTAGLDEIQRRLSELACDPEGGAIVRKYGIPIRDYKEQGKIADKGRVIKKEAVIAGEHVKKLDGLYGKMN